MSNLNNSGLSRVLSYIKNWVGGLLSNKSDTNHSHAWNDIASKPSFANVATSGSYNDLSNKPTIRTNILHFAYVSSLDANAILEDGIWYVYGGITGAPMSNHGVLVYVKSVGTPFQMYFPDDRLYVYKRICVDGAWQVWEK